MTISLHRLTRTFMEFLSYRVRSSFPEQGVTSYNCYTLQRCVTLPMRDQLVVAQPGVLPLHNSMMWGLVVGPSQSLPPSRPRMPPWCTPCPHNELRQWFIQTVRCQNYRGTMRVPTHMLHILYELPINMHATRITTTTCTSVFMREEEDTADFSIPFQISWSTRNIWR